ncbi:DUF4156 domain-containing protein [Litoreibacter sp.]|nr:DUF4156 domain-containing protein [Litoreibacter sp.]
MRPLISGFAIFCIAGCTPPAVALKTVRDAQPADVVGCQKIGRVTGVPGVYGPLAQIGLNDARKAAKKVALDQGANAVVFDEIPPGETAFEIKGTAYRC